MLDWNKIDGWNFDPHMTLEGGETTRNAFADITDEFLAASAEGLAKQAAVQTNPQDRIRSLAIAIKQVAELARRNGPPASVRSNATA